MQKPIILILIGFFTSCINQPVKNSNFTKEQAVLLQLDSTTILKVEPDSIITIDLNPYLKKQSFDFTPLVKEIKLISLETTDKSLVDDIYKILATDSYIYIYDKFKGGGLIIFDREGKFIRRIPNGQGPGELIRLYDIAYDAENNELVAYQHSFLLFFTPSGQFIRQKRLPIGFYNFTVIPDGYVFKALDRQGNGHLGQLEDYTLFVTDKNFKLKSAGLPVLPNDIKYIGYNYLYNNNNAIKVTQNFTDTIYQYINETNKLKANYNLNYSKKKLPERYLQVTYDEFKGAAEQNDYYFYIGEYLETEFHNIFSLHNWHTGNVTIYRDKKSGNMTGGTNTEFNPNEIPPLPPMATSGNYFVSTHFPNPNDTLLFHSAVISNEDKQKIKNLSEDDNPFLIFYTLNNF